MNNLTHTGDYSGVPFALRDWQAAPIRQFFGTLKPDGLRQYRKAFQFLPRKQGKTEIVAALSIYMMMGQGRPNQRIYTASGDKDQASLIFQAARDMIRNDPALAERTVIYEGDDLAIEYPAGQSEMHVLSAVPKTKHGLGPTGVLLDEYHVIDERLVRVLTTGFAARREPITWMITTAGDDTSSICYDEWEYAIKVRDGVIDDPSYLPIIYQAEPTDDWTDEATWFKAMPALGDFCSLEEIRNQFREAQRRPRLQASFKQLFLNLWVHRSTTWLSKETWDRGNAPIDLDELEGEPCFAGLDLGVTGDMSSFVRVFDRGDHYAIVPRFWAPEDGAWKQEDRNRSLYPMWADAGVLTFTDGEVTDHNAIEDAIAADHQLTPIKLMCADRAYASALLIRLFNHHGIATKGITQGPQTLNEPMTRLEEALLAGRVCHSGNPILAWNAANAKVRKNPTGLLYLDKSKRTERIDGLAATIDAFAAMVAENPSDSPMITESFLSIFD